MSSFEKYRISYLKEMANMDHKILPKPNKYSDNTLVIEKIAYDKAIDALKKIARGHFPPAGLAEETLEKLGEQIRL